MTKPYDPPLVRMEVELCKERLVYHVMQYLESVTDKIEPAVNAECERLFESDWFGQQVKKQSERAMKDALYCISRQIGDIQADRIFKKMQELSDD